MEQLLLQKEVTLACVTHTNGSKSPELEYHDMSGEMMILGLPASHPLAYLAGSKSYESFPEIDLKLLKDEKFTLISRETRLRDMIDTVFATAGFRPQILFESSSTLTVVNMVKNQVCVAYLKGSYLTKPEKYFIELATLYTRGLLK